MIEATAQTGNGWPSPGHDVNKNLRRKSGVTNRRGHSACDNTAVADERSVVKFAGSQCGVLM
jgi:hypothetical protein